MKGLFSVFKFEFLNRVKQKSILVTTLIMAAVILGLTFIPRFFDIFGSEESADTAISESVDSEDLDDIGYIISDNSLSEKNISAILSFGNPVKYNSEEELKKDIENDIVKSGFIFDSYNHFKQIQKNIYMYDISSATVQEGLSKILRDEKLESEGIDITKVDEAINQEVSFETINLGKDGISGFIFAYVGMFIVYMIVLMFGNAVATLVAREKSDRTMEILITNTSAKNLIVGKVFASTVVSFLQLALIFAAGIIGFIVNKSFYPSWILEIISQGLNPMAIFIFLLFTVLGCLMYFFLYAAFGALVSKVEEVNNATAPIQFIFIASFFATSMGIQMPDSMIMKVASIVPFSSPMSFFVRYTMIKVPIVQTLLAIGLLILTTVILAVISIKIYRMGTLNYGNKMGFFKTVKKLFEKQD